MASRSTRTRSKPAPDPAPDRASPLKGTVPKKRKHSELDSVKTETKNEKKQSRGEQTGSKGNQAGPYENLARPTAAECQAARDSLAALHGDPKRAALGEEKFELAQNAATAEGNSGKDSWQRTVLDALVCTILSQNTTDVNSHRAFAKLKDRFPTWEEVRIATNEDVEESIKSGGLAAIKTERIKAILNTVKAERGECSLEHLQQSTDDEIKAELERFKGVGKKTIACVLMFCLNRHEFPVDTHVWRITKSLGWIPAKATRDEAYAHLNARVPDELKYDLHVLLVNHGKRCPRCAKNGKPRKEPDGACPLFGKDGIASRKDKLNDSTDQLVKSEEDVPDASDKSARNARGKQTRTVKQEPSEIDVKQEPSGTASSQGVHASDSVKNTAVVVKEEGG